MEQPYTISGYTTGSSEFQSELGPDEKLLWTGKPKPGIRFSVTDIFAIPFSLFWCGFVVFWITMAIKSGAPIFFVLFSIPFIFVGAYALVGRFFMDALRRSKSVFAITNHRVILRTGLFRTETKSLPIHTLQDISYTSKSDGSGTITLGPNNGMMAMMNSMNYHRNKLMPTLEHIDNVKAVYDIIMREQMAKRS